MNPLYVDTDPGVDDAIALMMLVASGRPLVGLGAVAGNVDHDLALANLAIVLDAAGAPGDLPVHPGCASSLVGTHDDASYYHGRNGLGDVDLPRSRRRIADEHAALALVRLAREHRGRLEVLALGPLTNVAVALQLDPSVAISLARLVVMGGTIRGQGNVTAAAEFNAWCDPEAFARVLRAGAPLEIVSWETTLDHVVRWRRWDEIVEGHDERAEFARRITANARRRAEERGLFGFDLPDPLAATVALDPSSVIEADERFVEVVTGDGPSRGATTVDERPHRSPAPNARIVRRVDDDRFATLLRAAFAAPHASRPTTHGDGR